MAMIHTHTTLGVALTACLLFISTALVQAQEISFPAAKISPQTSSPAADKEIVAEGIGSGGTKQDALRDAMKKSIEKAVGMYVMSKTTMKDDELKEQIVVTSDAVVTNYKELSSSEHDGIWVVKIEAKVLPNEYLKYATKLITQDVSLDFANILNTAQAMDNAKEVIDEIFEDEYYKIYRFEKTAVRMGENAALNSNKVSVEIDYTLKFDKKEYDKFQEKFCNFLDKIAKYKYEGKRSTCTTIRNSVNGRVFKEIGMDDSERDNFRCIMFASINGTKEKKEMYKLYFIRKEIFDLIRPKMVGRVFLVFSFLPTDSTETIKTFVDAEISFGMGNWGKQKYDRPRNAADGIIFKSWEDLEIKGEGNSPVWYEASIHSSEGPFVNTLKLKDVPKDFLGQLKEMYIYILDNKDDLDEKEREKRANEIESKFWHK
jgi:hypothetical protein